MYLLGQFQPQSGRITQGGRHWAWFYFVVVVGTTPLSLQVAVTAMSGVHTGTSANQVTPTTTRHVLIAAMLLHCCAMVCDEADNNMDKTPIAIVAISILLTLPDFPRLLLPTAS